MNDFVVYLVIAGLIGFGIMVLVSIIKEIQERKRLGSLWRKSAKVKKIKRKDWESARGKREWWEG
ncbi:MAG: hypothetical protein QXQ64_08350 [Candidatus Bathyarchaeia archaeon]